MNQNNTARFIRQISYIVLIVVIAIVTWLNNERKTEQHHSPTQQSSATQTSSAETQQSSPINISSVDLGEYDSIMVKDKIGQNRTAPVDYYMLVLSWSPAFCDLQRERNNGNIPNGLKLQCESDQHFGWVIHGLWAQNSNAVTPADHPRYCQGDLAPLPEKLIRQYLPQSPGANLLQGEWEKHGACIFQHADDYFAKQKSLFESLNLPEQMLPRKELFQWLKQHNPALKNAYLGATKNELFICYNKQWQVIDCQK